MTKRRIANTSELSDDEKHAEFLKQFSSQDDRSAVILAAALAELHLGALLKKALLPSPDSDDVLLRERGTLGSLYARNHLCFRLGLIDIELFKAIEALRDIRNIYAHQLQYSNLSTEPYKSKIAAVYELISWYQPFVTMATVAFGSVNIGAMQFKAIAALVVLRLKQAVEEKVQASAVEPKSLVSAKWEVVRMGMQARKKSPNPSFQRTAYGSR